MTRRERRDGVAHEPALRAEPAVPAIESGLVGDEPALAALSPDARGFAEVYRERRGATRGATRWVATLIAVGVAGPFGILGALLGSLATGTMLAAVVLAVVVVAPVVEETVKAASAMWLAEVRPWLVPAAWVLPVITVAGGLGFAVIENWVYLNIYIEDPTEAIIRWRWIFGPTIHGIGSLIAGIGVARAWRRVHELGEPPSMQRVVPYLAAAAVFHGAYNGLALILEATNVI